MGPEAPVEPHDAPASYATQHLPQTQLPPHDRQAFVPRYAPNTRPDTYAVHDLTYPSRPEQWQTTPASVASQYGEQYLPSLQPRNDLLPPNDSRTYSHRSSNQLQLAPNDSDFVGLPSGSYSFQPQSHPCLEPASRFVRADGRPMGNVDGTGSEYEDRTNQYQSRFGLVPTSWGHARHLGHQPQPLEYNGSCSSPWNSSASGDTLPPQYPQPPRAYSVASHTALPNHVQPMPQPVVQQWRTDNLNGVKAPSSRQHTTDTLATRKSTQGQPDAATKRKQDIYRKKGEARRRTIAAGMAGSQTFSNKPPAPERSVVKFTKLPRKRRKLAPESVNEEQSPETAIIAYSDQSSSVVQPTAQILSRPTVKPTATVEPPAIVEPPMTVEPPVIVKPPLLAADSLPQPIVNDYDDYKWSVYHYELLSLGYDHAERWLEELFQGALQSTYTSRHVTHITRGFIQNGTRLSFVVLHNAANPFEHTPAPSSTVTIGVYGYHWHLHSEIHWTTLASDERSLFKQCVDCGHLREVNKWTPDPSNAKERRFHRAYWRAANMLELGGLLNRGPSEDVPHDLIVEQSEEDPDTDFCLTKADLMWQWGVTEKEAEEAWQAVRSEVAEMEGVQIGEQGWQHLVISSSE